MKKSIVLILVIMLLGNVSYAFTIDSVVFKNGKVVITENEKYGLLDHEFQTIFEPTYDYLKYIDDEHIIFAENGKYGIFNLARQPKIKPIYRDIVYRDKYYICQFDTGSSFKYDFVNMDYKVVRSNTLIAPSESKGYVNDDHISYIRDNDVYRPNERDKLEELEYFNTLLMNTEYYFDGDHEYEGLMEDPDEEYNFTFGIDNFGKLFRKDNREVWNLKFFYGAKSNPEIIIANWPRDLDSMVGNEGAIVCKNLVTEMIKYYTKSIDDAIDISDKIDYYQLNPIKLGGSRVVKYRNYDVAFIQGKGNKIKIQLLLR